MALNIDDCCRCLKEIFGVSTPIDPDTGMLFEQLPLMRFEDGIYMLFE